MTDDFAVLLETDHYLEWLGTNPAQIIRDEIERILRQQVRTATLKWIHLLDKPEFLTGGRKLFNDPSKMIMTRAALAVSFQMQVDSDSGEEVLKGVFSWVATGLDAERNDRVYLDLNMEMAQAAAMLKMRIYESASMPAESSVKQKRWWELW
jgi:hypothetical protein